MKCVCGDRPRVQTQVKENLGGHAWRARAIFADEAFASFLFSIVDENEWSVFD